MMYVLPPPAGDILSVRSSVNFILLLLDDSASLISLFSLFLLLNCFFFKIMDNIVSVFSWVLGCFTHHDRKMNFMDCLFSVIFKTIVGFFVVFLIHNHAERNRFLLKKTKAFLHQQSLLAPYFYPAAWTAQQMHFGSSLSLLRNTKMPQGVVVINPDGPDSRYSTV